MNKIRSGFTPLRYTGALPSGPVRSSTVPFLSRVRWIRPPSHAGSHRCSAFTGGKMNLSKSLLAEFFGTAWLVFGGCGAAVLAAGLPRSRHRFCRCRPGLRPHPAHHGLRHRPHLRMPPQSRRLRRPRSGQALSSLPAAALHRGAGARRNRRRGDSLRHRQG
jgi:hypothetical protein